MKMPPESARVILLHCKSKANIPQYGIASGTCQRVNPDGKIEALVGDRLLAISI
jgi:hypothetical protein